MYSKIIESFSDRIDINDFLNTFSFEVAKKSLLTGTNLQFLLGEPGTGKTFLLHYIMNEMDSKKFLFLPRGIESVEELLEALQISNIEFQKENFKVKEQLIIIDEAQLMDMKVIEYIRTLSDTKSFNFIISMHLKDGLEILKEEHFKSREIEVVKIDKISIEELERYVNKELIKNGLDDFIGKKEIKTVYKFSKGNFRYTKRVMKRSFELLQFATDNRITKYKKMDNRLITMASIDLGLVNE